MRVVLDTVVFVRALLNPRSYSGRILSEFTDRYSLVVSRETITELVQVLRRPELTHKYKRLASISLEAIVERVARAEVVELSEISAVVRDAKDDIFVATALAAQADFLVSEDRDLLVLGHRFGFEIVTTQTFIERMERELDEPI